MFFCKKLLSVMILPPGCFIILLLITAVWLARSRKKLAAAIIFMLALLLWLSATSWVAGGLIHSLEKDWPLPTQVKGDVIILLSGGIYRQGSDFSGLGVPSEEMFGRIVSAVRLQKRLHLPIIVSGGAVNSSDYAEAPVVKRVLVDLGVPEQLIYTEVKSRDTAENARYSREICRRLGFSAPIIVTSAFHMRRAMIAFRGEGMRLSPYPALIRTGGKPEISWANLAPLSSALQLTSTAFREYLGLTVYRIFPPR